MRGIPNRLDQIWIVPQPVYLVWILRQRERPVGQSDWRWSRAPPPAIGDREFCSCIGVAANDRFPPSSGRYNNDDLPAGGCSLAPISSRSRAGAHLWDDSAAYHCRPPTIFQAYEARGLLRPGIQHCFKHPKIRNFASHQRQMMTFRGRREKCLHCANRTSRCLAACHHFAAPSVCDICIDRQLSALEPQRQFAPQPFLEPAPTRSDRQTFHAGSGALPA